MPRPKTPVNRVLLLTAIMQAEDNGKLENRSVLYEKAAEYYNKAEPGEPITPSVVMLRLKDWAQAIDESRMTFDGYEIKTQPGKRGRAKLTDEQKAKMQEGRIAASEGPSKPRVKAPPHVAQALREAVAAVCPSRVRLAKKTLRGSKASAIKLFCLSCVGFQVSAVRDCTAIACPLYMVRPYQDNSDPEDFADLAEAEREEAERSEQERLALEAEDAQAEADDAVMEV